LVLDSKIKEKRRVKGASFCFGDTSPPGPLSKQGDSIPPEVICLERGLELERGLRPLSLTHFRFKED
jgi:hypothetical protein